MTLKEVREQFILKSGRYDLINEDGSDSGANFFIQAGQRFLDKEGDFGSGRVGSYRTTLEDGASTFLIPNCWSLLALYKSTGEGTDECWELLERVHSLECDRCRLAYGTYYTLLPIHSYPSLKDSLTSDVNIPASSLAISATSYIEDVTGLRVQLKPAIQERTQINAVGHFFSSPLTSDSSSSYWSTLYPETLLKAAMYELEVFYRNTEGAKDWLEAVQVDLSRLAQTELFASIQGDLTMGD